MGIVRSLNPSKDLEDFCNFLYGKEEGYIHIPIKDPTVEDGYSYNNFFKWPLEREEALQHIERHTKSAEVFITPGMFKTESSEIAQAHGSYVAWADFDGNAPKLGELKKFGIPSPTLRVQSSIPGHEHWYWKFAQFNTDIATIQGINKAICYALRADFAWDMGHSLRPVGTLNHKRTPVEVIVLNFNSEKYVPENFSKVPVPQEAYNLEAFKLDSIPDATHTLLKYAFDSEERELVSAQKVPKGERSSALTRLAYTCCEKGMDNSEVYSLLRWADSRWKKYSNRPNPEKYYVNLVNYVRQKIPYEGIKDVPALTEKLLIRSWKEVVNYDNPMRYLIDGLLPHRGVMYFVGPPGVGKTTLGMNICANLALGRGTSLGKGNVKWSPVEDKPLKILNLSLEMITEEVQEFLVDMEKNFTDEEQALLNENFFIYSEAAKVKFYQNNEILSKFLTTLDAIKPDVILIDSASRAIASNMSDQQEVVKSIERMELIREKFECAMLVIHHPRKDPPNHGYRESELDDMFGSQFIAASASSIAALKLDKDKESGLINYRELKARFKGTNNGFQLKMGNKRNFYTPTVAAIPAKTKPTTKKTKNDGYFSI